MENNTIVGLNVEKLKPLAINKFGDFTEESLLKIALMIRVSHCARISYLNHDGNTDYNKDIELHDRLLNANPSHGSAFEHCCKVPTELEYYSNVKGKVPTQKDEWGVLNQEVYPITFKNGNELDHKSKEERYGWFGNFKGFQSYRNILGI